MLPILCYLSSATYPQEWLGLLVSGARLVRVERAGHYIHKDWPDALAQAIRAVVAPP